MVTNTPDVLTGAVAEFTWALIFAAARRVVEGDRLVRRGAWKGWALDFLLGMELTGKQLGVIGKGRIGRAVAAKAAAFGMRPVFAARERPLAQDEVSLDELLIGSDVVTLHVPHTPATDRLIDRRALARMKRSAILINTARGPIVHEAALIDALNSRRIAGAGLDVFDTEPLPAHHPFTRLDNVVLTPHCAGITPETLEAGLALAIGNVEAFLGGTPHNVVETGQLPA